MDMTDEIKIIDVTAENVAEVGVFCIKDKKAPGYLQKVDWFKSKINQGLTIKIAVDQEDKQIGFVEYIPSELAWRPIKADNYFFIQCIVVFSKKSRENGIGSMLIDSCLQDAKTQNKSGICAMTSKGAWIADKSIFEKNDFTMAERRGRFELMTKTIDQKNRKPEFIDWTKQQPKFKGWNLVYADQCPWHEKSVTDLLNAAMDHGIELKVKKLTSPKKAQNGPSGYGTFALIKDGKLLEDHYLSRTRFENILRKEK
jgi:GNAT superfamily N-acetyltransferase